MATTPKKTSNFRTYEAQSRLLTAFIAAHDIRIDYKKVAEHLGKSTTASAVEHRFRPLRAAAERLRAAVRSGQDPGEIDIFDGTKGAPKELAKMYGESTPDGLQFQFRTIKANAEKMKRAVDRGEDPKTAYNSNTPVRGGGPSVPSTPTSGPGRKRKTPTSAQPKTPASKPPAARRGRVRVDYKEDSDNVDSPEQNYDELDASPIPPSKRSRAAPATASSITAQETAGASRASTLGTETEASTPTTNAYNGVANEVAMIKKEGAAFATNLADFAPAPFVPPATAAAPYVAPATSNTVTFGTPSFASAAPSNSFSSFGSTTQPATSAQTSFAQTSFAQSSFSHSAFGTSPSAFGSYRQPAASANRPAAHPGFSNTSLFSTGRGDPTLLGDSYGLPDYESDEGI